MKAQSENRRVRMTKRLMKDALLNLLERTELSGISVTAVCEEADVNRSTFYSYYTSPSELLREIEQEVLDRIPFPAAPQDRQGEENLLRTTEAFFDYVRENERVFRILFSESLNDGFSARIVGLLCAQMISGVEGTDEVSVHFLQLYIANGTVGLLREWIDAGFPVSSRKIAEMMYSFSRKIAD